MEILAPAGNIEILKVAIQAGCDAVYVSGKDFGARKFVANFTNEELEVATRYAHLRKKKIYVTVNTIIYDNEFSQLDLFLKLLVQIKVDAVIVQDYGVLYYIRKNYPQLIVHASTQMNIHNVSGALKLQKLGVKRVILARETPLDEVKKIVETGIEVEVFAHGALCYSYSGQCLMSYMIGGRSGNRGECAQPCRRKYSLKENSNIVSSACSLLSMKDLNTIDYLESLVKIGVTSIKIEGRMKSIAYVYSVISSYYKYLNKIKVDDIHDKLKVAFNREFTKGYMFQESNFKLTNVNGVNHQGLEIGKIQVVKNDKIGIKTTHKLEIGDAIRIKSNKEIGFYIKNLSFVDDLVFIPGKYKVTIGDKVYKMVDDEELKNAKNSLLTENYHIDLSITFEAYYQNKLKLSVKGEGVVVEVETVDLNEMAKTPLDFDRIASQLVKTGDKLLNIKNVDIKYDQKCFLKISDINEIRRLGTKKWQEEYIEAYKLPNNLEFEDSFTNIMKKDDTLVFDFVVQNEEQASWCKNNGYQHIYKTYDDTYTRHFHLTPSINKKTIIHNFGDLTSNKIVSQAFNIVNKYALQFIDGYNVDTIYLSNELKKDDLISLAKIPTNSKKGVFIYGHMEVMTSKHCFINKIKGINRINCLLCHNNKYSIVDEYGNQMYVGGRCSEDGPEIRIYSYKLTNELKNIKDFYENGITHFMVLLTNETKKELDYLNNVLLKYRG